jgi:hypothetical protein
MASGGMVYNVSLIKIGSRVQNLKGGSQTDTDTHTHTRTRTAGDFISLFSFFKMEEAVKINHNGEYVSI